MYASMGPAVDTAGNGQSAGIMGVTGVALQWGQRLIPLETLRTRSKRAARQTQASMGPAVDTAGNETHSDAVCQSLPHSFNGASG